MDLVAEITARLNDLYQKIDPAITEIGDAWAGAARVEAPRGPSGTLGGSIAYTHRGQGEGSLVLAGYGDIVGEGIPGSPVSTLAQRTVSMPPLSQTGRAIKMRARYARKVGRVITHPNPFYERAWNSNGVQALVADLPERLAK